MVRLTFSTLNSVVSLLLSMNPIDTLATHSPYLQKVRRDEGLKNIAVSFLISVTCIRNALAISSTPPGDLETTHNTLPFPLPFLSPLVLCVTHTFKPRIPTWIGSSSIEQTLPSLPHLGFFQQGTAFQAFFQEEWVPTHQCTHRAKTSNYCPRSKSQVYSTNYLNVLLCFLHYYPNTSSQRWFQRSCPGLFPCESLKCRLKAPIAYKVKLNLLRKKLKPLPPRSRLFSQFSVYFMLAFQNTASRINVPNPLQRLRLTCLSFLHLGNSLNTTLSVLASLKWTLLYAEQPKHSQKIAWAGTFTPVVFKESCPPHL